MAQLAGAKGKEKGRRSLSLVFSFLGFHTTIKDNVRGKRLLAGWNLNNLDKEPQKGRFSILFGTAVAGRLMVERSSLEMPPKQRGTGGSCRGSDVAEVTLRR